VVTARPGPQATERSYPILTLIEPFCPRARSHDTDGRAGTITEDPGLISVADAAVRLGVSAAEIRVRIAVGQLVGILDGGELKLPVDQPALEGAAEVVILTRQEALDILAAVELARNRLGTVDLLNVAYELIARRMLGS